MSETPNWEEIGEQLAQAGRDLAEGFARMGYILNAQGAMGWAFQGDFDKARETLRGMPREQVELVAMAATALAAMAKEDTEARP